MTSSEEKLIPFHPSDLTGRRVLVLAPHPDDETVGCGGSLALHARAGDPVKVVFLTNGARGEGHETMATETYVNIRQGEAKKACTCFGTTDLEFWAYEDRALAESHGVLKRMMALLEQYQPQLVYVTSILEFHPDHRAACFLLCDALRGSTLGCDVAFYEVGQPLGVNLLVDITPVVARKAQAIEVYASQLVKVPYGEICMALNRFRSLTLGKSVTHAEGYLRCEADLIRKVGPLSLPFQQGHRLAAGPGETGPLVSVIVRTRNRPAPLANALRSVARQTYVNLEVVVVNDGGQEVRDVIHQAAGDLPVTHIVHETCRGRSAAANAGLKAARGTYLNFLDDDDVFYPDHVKTLARHLQTGEAQVAYTSILSAHFKGPPAHPESCIKRVVNHDVDFNPDRLLFQNYLPLMGVMFHSDILSTVGMFDPDLDLFEDWDFWIRASRHFRFHHINKVTAEYRFYGAETTEASHRGKYAYDKARARIYDRITPFLTGETWCALLRAEWFDELKVGGKKTDAEKAGQDQAEAIYQTNQPLQEAHDLIGQLRAENVSYQEQLKAIYASRGWRWLNRYGRLKRRLGFGSSRADGNDSSTEK